MKKYERTKNLLKNTAIFTISNITTKLITFFLIPLYTYCLNTEEYGIIDLFFTIATVLIPLFTLNVMEGVYRFAMDEDKKDNRIVSIALIMFLSCLILSLLIIPIMDFFGDYEKFKYYFYFYIVTSAGFQIFSVNLKGKERLKEFAISNIINTFFIAILNILFLKYLNLKIEGYFLAYIISNCIAWLYCFIVGDILNSIKNFNFDFKIFKEMIKYSVVLIPTSFLWWIMKASDRVMLTYFYGLALNGIYAISYKIPTILQVIANIFNQAWVFTAVKEKDTLDNEKYTNIIFKKLYISVFVVSMSLLLGLKPLFRIYVSNDYYTAWKYVPFLLLGTVFVTLGTFLSSSYNAHKDSKGFLFSGIAGAIINIILNLLLIPKFNAYGAAIATGISYIVVFIYRLIDTRKYVKIYFSKDYIFPCICTIISSILLYFESNFSYIIQLGLIITVIIVYKEEWLVPLKSYVIKRGEKNV